MSEQDFTKRLTIVVRKDIEGWQAANAIAHIAAYLGNRLGEDFDTGDAFIAADGVAFPRNSQYPIILKSADSSEALHEALSEARKEGVLYLAFARNMIDHSDDRELEESLRAKPSGEIELLGLGVFGENEQIKALTKPFGLWK